MYRFKCMMSLNIYWSIKIGIGKNQGKSYLISINRFLTEIIFKKIVANTKWVFPYNKPTHKISSSNKPIHNRREMQKLSIGISF